MLVNALKIHRRHTYRLSRLFSTQNTFNRFHAGVWFQPHFQKVAKGGEDAASVSSNVVAVADGVGGWADQGVDPANFSKQLCRNIDSLVYSKQEYITDPKSLLIEACSQNNEVGSSTCVIATIDLEKPLLRTCNLGDSGYMLLRKSGLDLVQVFRSKE